jgi:hypothetical protein
MSCKPVGFCAGGALGRFRQRVLRLIDQSTNFAEPQ